MIMDYFRWMNEQIIETCHFSISDFVGMSLSDYVASVHSTICPDRADQGKFYLLVVDGHAVSMGGMRRLQDGSAEVVRIYTQPGARGKGYGGVMLSRLIADAEAWGCPSIKLDTGNFMKSAHRLYETFGFTETLPYFGAEPPPELFPFWRFMERPLNTAK